MRLVIRTLDTTALTGRYRMIGIGPPIRLNSRLRTTARAGIESESRWQRKADSRVDTSSWASTDGFSLTESRSNRSVAACCDDCQNPPTPERHGENHNKDMVDDVQLEGGEA
jgi:hypothetical protein